MRERQVTALSLCKKTKHGGSCSNGCCLSDYHGCCFSSSFIRTGKETAVKACPGGKDVFTLLPTNLGEKQQGLCSTLQCIAASQGAMSPPAPKGSLEVAKLLVTIQIFRLKSNKELHASPFQTPFVGSSPDGNMR